MKIWLAIIFAALAGCASEPFTRETLPDLQSPDPSAIRESFGRVVPMGFVSDDSVIVSPPFHDAIAFLGVLKVDRSNGTFELAGLNQTGIKLFELSGTPSGTTVRFAVPPLMNHKDILLALGTDIRRMFFDLVPPAASKTRIDKTDVKFLDGKMVYKLGGNPAVLLEKREDGFFGPAWRVRYFRYTSDSGRLYPRGIVMDNGQYHYRIVVKNRDVDFGQ